MSEYINKVIALFTREKLSGTTKKGFHDWLVDGEPSEEKEQTLFHLWNQPNNITREQSLKSLAQLKTKLPSIKKDNKVVMWRYAAAIALFICLTTAYIFTNKSSVEVNFVEHYSPIGKVNTITLPDGSVVQTNSSTILVYPENFGEDTRTLYLTGEANFKVVKNEKIPFIVKSKEFSITALGTEFNVASYPDDLIFKTTLISGSVSVKENESTVGQVLEPNEQFAYNKVTSEKIISTVDMGEATAWQRGELVFRGSTMKEISKVLERKYGVTFHFKTQKNAQDKYNFKFKKDASFAELIDVIKNVADDFEYKIVGDICYVY